jgi:hypothetical protein
MTITLSGYGLIERHGLVRNAVQPFTVLIQFIVEQRYRIMKSRHSHFRDSAGAHYRGWGQEFESLRARRSE